MKTASKTLTTVILMAAVLGGGLLGMLGLALLRQEPAKATQSERAIHVQALRAQPVDEPVIITGYGEVRPLNVVSIIPEVSGAVAEVHPRLHVGEVIPKGETLFVIDPRTYEARREDARATANQLAGTVERLRIQSATDQARLKTLERTRDLAKAEYERLRALFEEDQVGTKSGVEQAEQAYNSAADRVDQMKQMLDMYPVQIAEARNGLTAAKARTDQAQIDLERTRMVAPFNARIRTENVERGQYVAPGAAALSLADDSILEISVPLDSGQARRWLLFDEHSEDQMEAAWFSNLKPVECEVYWTEEEEHFWVGALDRVEKFDENTRTITVAVRVTAEQARGTHPGQLPLVEGMFCEVRIPGKVMESVYRLPRSVVSFQGTVYVAEENRLRTTPVNLLHEQGDFGFVSEGLAPEDLVVLTRLVNPLERALLDVEVVEADDRSEAEEATS